MTTNTSVDLTTEGKEVRISIWNNPASETGDYVNFTANLSIDAARSLERQLSTILSKLDNTEVL